MPNTASAKKALRQNAKCRLRNRAQRSALRTTLKKFRLAAAGQDPSAAETAFRLVVKKLDQAAGKGLIHKNKAARTKSRLSRLLAAKAAPQQEPSGEPASES
ncbi:MAG: 30S ribosomal protein S20 [Planctomycetaceae bacterium]